MAETDSFYSVLPPTDCIGIDINYSDGGGPPTTTGLTSSEVESWFTSHPESGEATMRLLVYYMPRRQKQTKCSTPPSLLPPISKQLPFNRSIVDHAFWKPDTYAAFSQTRAGGAAVLLDDPYRFMLQTPFDNGAGPFVSMALSRRGIVIKGIYIYDDPLFEPTRILAGETMMSGWRSTGMQIMGLPHAVARAQAAWVGARLSNVAETVAGIEQLLVDPTAPITVEGIDQTFGRDFTSLSRSLQACGATLIDLERRSRFEANVLAAIENLLAKDRYGSQARPALAPLHAQIDARAYEFEVVPRRIENARMTIGNLVQQHNDRMNFETAESSRRIAEATLSESASMKAIAVLTMLFLPGTAVASFFSMAMFNWNSDSGSGLASKWLWIYFVVAVPMTAFVIGIWLVFSRRMKQQTLRELNVRGRLHRVQTDLMPFADQGEDRIRPQQVIQEDMEMETIEFNPSISKGKSNSKVAWETSKF